MHEVTYLQFGNLPNYIGTHFWNTQDCYSQEEAVQEISWSIREEYRGGVGGRYILRPRALIFDEKRNLGALYRTSIDVEYGAEERETPPQNKTWSGSVTPLSEPIIRESQYLSRLNSEADKEDAEELLPPKSQEISYWSDFSHVYFSPHSIHTPIQNLNTGISPQQGAVTWAEGWEAFQRYEQDVDLMETSLRKLLEECDSPQGFQVSSHIPSFGGFTAACLERVVDEYPKLGLLNFAIMGEYSYLWDKRPKSVTSLEKPLLSNVLMLKNLADFSQVSVPLLPSTMWSMHKRWKDPLPGLEDTLYHTSSVYATHIENITWPIRKTGQERWFDAIAGILNGDSRTPFSCLEGMFPVLIDEGDSRDCRLDLSMPQVESSGKVGILSSYTVSRGLPAPFPNDWPDAIGAELAMGNMLPLRKDFRDPQPVPVPLSQPQIFYPPSAVPASQMRRLDSVAVFSRFAGKQAFGEVLRRHINWSANYIDRGGDLRGTGMQKEELKEVIEELRSMTEAYSLDAYDEEGEQNDGV